MSETNERRKVKAMAVAADIAPDLGRGLEGAYYEYRDGIWRRDPHVVTRRVAGALGDDYTASIEQQVKAHLLNIYLPSIGVRDIKGFLPYVVLDNCVYHWETDTTAPHAPELGALTRLPIYYAAGATCPAFDAWLSDTLSGDADLVAHVWEVLGYCLMTGNPFQKAILLYGEGRNGKGTFLRILRRLLGPENYSALSLHTLVEDRFSAASLYGMIANISGDLSDRFLKQPEIIKQITGGDAITASHKYGQPFTFVPYAVPVFAANTFFRASDTSHGWRRRWLVIDFLRRFEEGTFNEDDLLDEAAGIFNAAMCALRRLMERGAFAPPQRALDAAQRLHDEDDPFSLWLEEDPAVDLDPEMSTYKTDVYARYSSWSRRNGYMPMASNLLGKRLADVGVSSVKPRTGNQRIPSYRGIFVAATPSD